VLPQLVAKIKQFVDYLKESREELRKVTWPDRDEVTSFTIVVVITVIMISLFLWFVDSALMKLIKVVMG
jgi:preprotein translocase subunit SecE